MRETSIDERQHYRLVLRAAGVPLREFMNAKELFGAGVDVLEGEFPFWRSRATLTGLQHSGLLMRLVMCTGTSVNRISFFSVIRWGTFVGAT